MKAFLILSLALSHLALADDVTLKGHYFEGDAKKVNFMKGNEVIKFEKKPSLLTDRDKREAAFKEANLEQEIKKLDEVDRDLLFYKIKEYALDDVKKAYPQIRPDKLVNLKKVAERY